MFISIIIISLLHLVCYDFIGKGIKKLFNIDFNGMNLLIGYSFSLLLFYFINFYFFINNNLTIMEKLFPLYIIILIPFIYLGIKYKKHNYDYLIIVIIFLVITHFFTLTFIVPNEAKDYLSSITRNTDLSIFQVFTLLEAQFFKIQPLVYAINIVTIVNLFIILYTIYDCIQIFFSKKKTKRYAFLFFLLIFIVLNSPNKNVILPHNAYQFLYYSYSGNVLYLYALIPFQLVLLSNLNKRNDILIALINLSCISFTFISITMQIIFNVSYIILLIFIKNRVYIIRFIYLSLYSLFIHFLIFNFNLSLLIIFIIIALITYQINIVMNVSQKYRENNISIYGIIGLNIIFAFLLLINYHFPYYPSVSNFQYDYKEKIIILLYYILVIYSLFKIYKDKENIKQIFIYLTLIILVLIINPITLYLVLNYQFSLINLLFLLPTTFVIIYAFFKHTKIIEKALIILLIISVSQTIYYPFKPINQTKKDVYYRINKEAVDISNYINDKDDIENIIVCENLQDELLIYTKKNLLINNSDDILYLNLMINDLIPFDLFYFVETINAFNVDVIIIDKDKEVNKYLEVLSVNEEEFGYYKIYFI